MFAQDRLPITGLRIFWIAVALWYELIIFFRSTASCRWPEILPVPGSRPVSQQGQENKSTHVLIVADPQILDHRSYPGRPALFSVLTQFIVDLNLRKSWRAALQLEPDAVVFLGDLMDGGRFAMTASEYERYYRRFKSIFKVDPTMPVYYLPGNHDIGLGVSPAFSKHARERYISHFGPLNSIVSIANHSIVLLDAPSLVEEDYQRTGSGLSFQDWRPVRGGPVEFIRSFAKGRGTDKVILFTHIPLSRPDGSPCGPLRERGSIRRGVGFGYQNTLGKHTTDFLLERLQPSLVFSGDDHDYCEFVHATRKGSTPVREVTVKSLSIAMGVHTPGFQLLSLVPPDGSGLETTHADTPCLLPNQLEVYLTVYIPLIAVSLVFLLITNVYRARTSAHRLPLHLSLAHIEDAGSAWASAGPSPINDIRFRPEIEHYIRSPEEDDITDSPTSHLSHSGNFNVSTNKKPLFSWSYTFVLRGRRRRITIGTHMFTGLIAGVVELLHGSGNRWKRNRRGVSDGLLHDVLDIIYFPLGVFVLISWWMFSR